MLTYTLQQKSEHLAIILTGPVDERSPQILNELLGRLNAKTLVLDMQGVEYFNSLGIRAWANFVKPLTEGRSVSYERCPPDFINQINMMPLLADSIRIQSFSSAFICPNCNHTQTELFDATQEKSDLIAAFESKVCDQCGTELLPDEDPDTFLHFKES